MMLCVEESLAASHKCHFRVRHFGRVFALPYKSTYCRILINVAASMASATARRVVWLYATDTISVASSYIILELPTMVYNLSRRSEVRIFHTSNRRPPSLPSRPSMCTY